MTITIMIIIVIVMIIIIIIIMIVINRPEAANLGDLMRLRVRPGVRGRQLVHASRRRQDVGTPKSPY